MEGLKAFIEWFTQPYVLVAFMGLSFIVVACCVYVCNDIRRRRKQKEEEERQKKLDMFN